MNQELDRTEELLGSVGKSNNKKKLIIIVIVAAVLAAGAGVFAGIKIHSDKQIKGQLKTADALLAEGKYEKAIAAYDKVIEMDEGNAFAYEGKGDAYNGAGKPKEALENLKTSIDKDNTRKEPYVKAIRTAVVLGDDKEADRLTEEMHKNIKGTDDENAQTLSMSCASSNVNAEGIVCENGSDLYIANKPNRGDITKVDKDGKETVAYTYKNITNMQSVKRLNIWNDWIYFTVSEIDSKGDEKAKLHRVKTDGSEEEELLSDYEVNDKCIIINDKIYFQQSLYYPDITSTIYSCDLNGENVKTISNSNPSSFVTDGKSLFYKDNPISSGSGDTVKKYDALTGKTHSVKASNLKYGLDDPIAIEDNYLYCGGIAGNTAFSLEQIDLSSGKAKVEERTSSNICRDFKDQIMYYHFYFGSPSAEKMYECSVEDGKKLDYYFESYSVKDEKQLSVAKDGSNSTDGVKGGTHFRAGASEMGAGKDFSSTITAHPVRMQVIGDKIYYSMLTVESTDDNSGARREIFGCVDKDSKNNQIYGVLKKR